MLLVDMAPERFLMRIQIKRVSTRALLERDRRNNHKASLTPAACVLINMHISNKRQYHCDELQEMAS
ncbi:hypothetical protein DPMN_024021 [Dreissena polymorpha]|uniref:Uncharacterized protein n=1 Tax=Dreissena polymorpha TaxID=45954 RepID=A0A9D4LNZ8_DREPO|nr:hypothetical protein DPMN_024021 [Dreissena polymorpha]